VGLTRRALSLVRDQLAIAADPVRYARRLGVRVGRDVVIGARDPAFMINADELPFGDSNSALINRPWSTRGCRPGERLWPAPRP
jgi:hypothetical protein